MRSEPIKIAVLAMGGEGGGVLADWIVDLGEANGCVAQTTSVPGVAQRTGATIYYVELFPRSPADAGRAPVLALMPLPGDVDVVLASELMEAGRALQRGLVTPDRTTLVASTHRVYAIAEKMAMGDGRVDSAALLAACEAAAKRFVRFDMAAAAEASGSVISAVLFGALAGTGVLPFARSAFEATIERGGVGVKASLKAFGAAYDRAYGSPAASPSAEGDAAQAGAPAAAGRARPAPPAPGNPTSAAPTTASVGEAGATPAAGGSADARSTTLADASGGALAAPQPAALDGTTDAPEADGGSPAGGATRDAAPTTRHPVVRGLLERVRGTFPAAAHAFLLEGVRRTIDYQDPDYATLYLDRLDGIRDAAQDPELLRETARHLALWMTYEDTIRVADLKTRATRFDRVATDVHVNPDQLLAIEEFMHPRAQEICETLPAPLGKWLAKPSLQRKLLERFTRSGRVVDTTSLRGFLMLYAVASMRRFRRASGRYLEETARIDRWLQRIREAARHNPQLATAIAKAQRLVKGYGDTHARGLRNYHTVMDAVDRAGHRMAPATVNDLVAAALADEHGHALQAALARQPGLREAA